MKRTRKPFIFITILVLLLFVSSAAMLSYADESLKGNDLSEWSYAAGTGFENDAYISFHSNASFNRGLEADYVRTVIYFDKLDPIADLNDWSSYIFYNLSHKAGVPNPDFLNPATPTDDLPGLALTLRNYNGKIIAGINGYGDSVPGNTRAYSYSPERQISVAALGQKLYLDFSCDKTTGDWEVYINDVRINSNLIALPGGRAAGADGKTYLSFITSQNTKLRVYEAIHCLDEWHNYDIVYPVAPYPETNYDEPYRNQFHFSTQGGWQYDVNGLIYLDGEYHMFYQHNLEYSETEGRSHTGHAVSRDMVHWTQMPVATQPGIFPGLHNWSGSAVVDTKNVSGFKKGDADPIVMFYSGVDFGISIAYSSDRGRTFKNYAGNPVINSWPSDYLMPRDPKVFYYEPDNKWIMIIYENGSTFYTSENLRDWKKVYNNDFGFECPDMFRLPLENNEENYKWVLADASGAYLIGDFDGTKFIPDNNIPQKLDYGSDYYAGQTFSVNNFPDGRIISIAWMHNWQQPELPTIGWTNSSTFPTELKLIATDDGLRLKRTPIDEISLLYGNKFTAGGRTYVKSENPLESLISDKLDITMVVDIAKTTATKFGIAFSDNYSLMYDKTTQMIDGKLVTPINGKLKMRFLRDASSVELFVNDGLFCYTNEVQFNLNNASVSIEKNGGLYLESLTAYSLKSAWDTSSHSYAAVQENVKTNLSGKWTAYSGRWNSAGTGIQGESEGPDAFYLYSGKETSELSRFSLEADVAVNQGLGSLIFRAASDLSYYYSASIQRCYTEALLKNSLRLLRKDPDGNTAVLGVFAMPGNDMMYGNNGKVIEGKYYHLKVVCDGGNIKVYLGSKKVIETDDNTHSGNNIALNTWGVNSFNPQSAGGYSNFNNIIFSKTGFSSNIGTNSVKTAGQWTERLDGIAVRPSAAFPTPLMLSSSYVTDFVLEGTLNNYDNAAGFIFRASSENDGYKVTLDRRNNTVNLYAGRKLSGSFHIYLDFSIAAQIKIAAYKDRLQIYVNGQLCFNLTDKSYSVGYIGLIAEGFGGEAVFNGVTVRSCSNSAALSAVYAYDKPAEINGNAIIVDVPLNTKKEFLPLISAHTADPGAHVSIIQAGIGYDSKAIITVTAENGVDKQVYDVIFRESLPVGQFEITNAIESLKAGSSFNLGVNLPSAYAVLVKWSSLNPAVATVSSSGVVTALTSGNTTIKAEIGSFCDEFALTVFDDLPPDPEIRNNITLKNLSDDICTLSIDDALKPLDEAQYTINNSADGYEISALEAKGADFIINVPVGKNYTFETDIKITENADAGFLIFCTENGNSFLLQDNLNNFLDADKFYRLKLSVNENNYEVYIDGVLRFYENDVLGFDGAENIFAGLHVSGAKVTVSDIVITNRTKTIEYIMMDDVKIISDDNRTAEITVPRNFDAVPKITVVTADGSNANIIYPDKLPGKYYISVLEPSGLIASLTLDVQKSAGRVSTEEIIFSNTSLTLEKNEVHQIDYLLKPYFASFNDIIWESSNEAVAVVDKNGIITALTVGNTLITATSDGLSKAINVNVIILFTTNLPGGNPVSGNWTKSTAGLTGSGAGDNFYMFDGIYSDFTYEGDLQLNSVNGVTNAIALIFRASSTGDKGYCFNLQKNDDGSVFVRLFRFPYRSPADDLYILKVDNSAAARQHHFSVKAIGSAITLTFDNTLLTTVSDTLYSSGFVGVNQFNGQAIYQNIMIKESFSALYVNALQHFVKTDYAISRKASFLTRNK